MPALDPETVLTALAERRILLACEDGRLRFRAPEGALDEPLRGALRAHREGIVAALQARPGFVQPGPPSYNQLSLFFLQLLDPSSSAYNLALTLRLRSPAESAALREAVARLIRQHPQLRTTFGHLQLGGLALPCQFSAEYLAPEFAQFDARQWPEAELRRRAQSFYAMPLNLETGPTVRVGLFQGAAGGDVLLLQFHHIAVDGWSLNRVARDFGRHYAAAAAGRDAEAPPVDDAYLDFSLAQRRWLASPDGASQLQYWRDQLLPPPPALEPASPTRRPAARRTRGATRHFTIAAAERARIEAAATGLGVTPFALLLAVFQAWLLRRARTDDLAVGVPTLGRRSAREENTVGYFVNPVALRCRRSTALTFREHAQRTAQELAAALDRRDLPFAALVERLGIARDPARTPGFQVLFNLLSRRVLGDAVDLLYPGADATTVDLGPGLPAGAFPLDQQEGQFDLTLEFVERGETWVGLFKYCTDLFDAGEVDARVAEYTALLARAATDPDGLLVGGAVQPHDTPAEATQPPADRRVVVVASTFTAEPMQDAFAFWFERLGWPVDLAFAPFNQVLQELLNPASLLRRATHGYGIVFLRCDDLVGLPSQPGATAPAASSAYERLRANLDELLAVCRAQIPNLRIPLCVAVCPSSPHLCNTVPEEPALRAHLVAQLQALPGVQVLSPERLAQWYPVDLIHEPAGEELGHIPYSPRFLDALATGVVRVLHSSTRKPVKALVVDCDGTLWDGVVGEEGPEGVRVTAPQRKFQEFLLEQHRAGVVLCLCSKNQEADVWAVFDRHPGMVLRREHIAFSRINWLPKSENLRALAAEINIGLDALGFLDDNELERAEVRAGCPAVLCVELPGPWEDRVPYLRHLWPLDRARVTAEDRQRVEHYRTDRQRSDLQRGTATFAEFLERLELVVEIRPAGPAELDRLAQLSIRTNQFNTTVRRLSVPDLTAYLAGPGQAGWVVQVRDRFGDYGIVGAMLAAASGTSLRVDSLLLSCRALGRGVEHRMVAYLAGHAVAAGCTGVEFPLLCTDRNEPARAFLEGLHRQAGAKALPGGAVCVESERLARLQFTPDDCLAEPPPTAASAPPRTPEAAVAIWEPALMAVAQELGTPASISAAVSRWRERRHQRPFHRFPTTATTVASTEAERTLVEAWKKVLVLPEVGTNENFFEVGGTSILLAQVALELRRAGIAVTLVDLFQYPTIRALARFLRDRDTPTAPTRPEPPAVDATSGPARALPAAFERLRRFRGR